MRRRAQTAPLEARLIMEENWYWFEGRWYSVVAMSRQHAAEAAAAEINHKMLASAPERQRILLRHSVEGPFKKPETDEEPALDSVWVVLQTLVFVYHAKQGFLNE